MKFLSSNHHIGSSLLSTKDGTCKFWDYGNMLHWYFPFKSPSANEWGSHRHVFKKSYYRQKYKKLFNKFLDIDRKVNSHNNRKAQVVIRSERKRLLDKDNFISGFKPIIDAMRDANILREDNPKWLDCNYEQYQSSSMSYFDIYLMYKDELYDK